MIKIGLRKFFGHRGWIAPVPIFLIVAPIVSLLRLTGVSWTIIWTVFFWLLALVLGVAMVSGGIAIIMWMGKAPKRLY